MLDGVMLLWFILTGCSLAFVAWDSFFNTPTSRVQQVAWLLVVFYTGPVGLFFYFLACRNPGVGMHDAFTDVSWKQSLNSEMHCLAGDATGILVAAIVVSSWDIPNGIDLGIEYATGFVSGLFIFQALMMIGMYGGNYIKAVRKTFFAETVSMNMVMVGMFGTMIILKDAIPEARHPEHAAFWFVMGMGTIVGGVTAYPINAWLVRNGLKHGCMTVQGRDERPKATPPAAHEHAGHASHQHHDMHDGEEHSHPADHEGMQMKSIAAGPALLWMLGTSALMVLALWLVSIYITPIRFS